MLSAAKHILSILRGRSSTYRCARPIENMPENMPGTVAMRDAVQVGESCVSLCDQVKSMSNVPKQDKLASAAERKQVSASRDALIQELESSGQPTEAEAFLRAACRVLGQVLEEGETQSYTQEALLVLIMQELIDKLEGKKGDQVLAREITRYVGHKRLKCDRNKVYRLRKKYDLKPSGTRTAWSREAATRAPSAPRLTVVPGSDRSRPDASESADDATGPLDDPLYVERPADRRIEAYAQRSGTTVIIRGPRGFGTTSLLNRYLAHSQQRGKQVASVDFSFLTLDRRSLPAGEKELYAHVLGVIASEILHTLRPGTEVEKLFDTQLKFTHFMEDEILAKASGPVVLAFDRVDRIFGEPFKDDFFAMVRYWHNLRSKYTPNNRWRNTDLVLITSTDPANIIRDPSLSPFSVGETITLEPFDLDTCRSLPKRYEVGLTDAQARQLYNETHGHPLLLRRAYEHLRDNGAASFESLMASAAAKNGPFSGHLMELKRTLERNKVLKSYRRFVKSGKGLDPEDREILLDHGLVREVDGEPQVFCPIFAKYFQ